MNDYRNIVDLWNNKPETSQVGAARKVVVSENLWLFGQKNRHIFMFFSSKILLDSTNIQ